MLSSQHESGHEFETMARGDSPIHRLDPRAKLVTTLVFIVTVMSFKRHEISAVIPFALFPVLLIGWSGLPVRPLAKALVIASPFAVLVAAFNPFFERQTVLRIGGIALSGGWLSFISVILRFVLTVSAALIMVATTGIYRTALALERLGMPSVFVLQVLFVWRYLFVLGEESMAIRRARELRGYGRRVDINLFGRLVGNLLIRTLGRAERIHRAMCARGFDGTVRFAGHLKLCLRDIVFCAAWCAVFVVMRVLNVSRIVGGLVIGVFP